MHDGQLRGAIGSLPLPLSNKADSHRVTPMLTFDSHTDAYARTHRPPNDAAHDCADRCEYACRLSACYYPDPIQYTYEVILTLPLHINHTSVQLPTHAPTMRPTVLPTTAPTSVSMHVCMYLVWVTRLDAAALLIQATYPEGHIAACA